MQARALGSQGMKREVRRLSGHAVELFAHLSAEQSSSSVFAMSGQQLQLYIANALRQAGDVDASLEHYQRSLALFPEDEPLDPVLTRIDQATALVQAHEIEAGCHQVIQQLSDIQRVWRTPLMVTWAMETHAAVPGRFRSQKSVRDLAELLRDGSAAAPV